LIRIKPDVPVLGDGFALGPTIWPPIPARQRSWKRS